MIKSGWGRFIRALRRICAVIVVWEYAGLNWYLNKCLKLVYIISVNWEGFTIFWTNDPVLTALTQPS